MSNQWLEMPRSNGGWGLHYERAVNGWLPAVLDDLEEPTRYQASVMGAFVACTASRRFDELNDAKSAALNLALNIPNGSMPQ